MTITTDGASAFRDYVTDGVPASGTHPPEKADIRALFAAIDDALGEKAPAEDAVFSTAPQLPSYTVAGVPSAATAGKLIYVSNETGGAVVAFSDGTNWRRVTDRAVVSA